MTTRLQEITTCDICSRDGDDAYPEENWWIFKRNKDYSITVATLTDPKSMLNDRHICDFCMKTIFRTIQGVYSDERTST